MGYYGAFADRIVCSTGLQKENCTFVIDGFDQGQEPLHRDVDQVVDGHHHEIPTIENENAWWHCVSPCFSNSGWHETSRNA